MTTLKELTHQTKMNFISTFTDTVYFLLILSLLSIIVLSWISGWLFGNAIAPAPNFILHSHIFL